MCEKAGNLPVQKRQKLLQLSLRAGNTLSRADDAKARMSGCAEYAPSRIDGYFGLTTDWQRKSFV